MNPRYKELKFDGSVYTKRYEIDEILIDQNCGWFIDCEVENMRLEITKDTLVINSGIWYNGTFVYGVIRDIEFRNGRFENGVIYNGVFKKIIIEKCIIFNGTFLSGEILDGDIRGGDFRNIKISSTCKRATTITVQQPPVTQPLVHEKYIKKFKDFIC